MQRNPTDPACRASADLAGRLALLARPAEWASDDAIKLIEAASGG
jgi:hypothetical protein